MQVATALQVFYNLGSLQHIVEKVVNACKEHLYENVRKALDVQNLTPQHQPGRGLCLYLMWIVVIKFLTTSIFLEICLCSVQHL